MSATERLGPSDLGRAVEILLAGGLVAIPTETVYGLAGDAASAEAVAGIFAAKGRPAGHPLIVHVGTPDELADWADPEGLVDGRARRLAEACWPGPLTLIVSTAHRAVDAVTGGRPTVGVRVPDHPLTLDLLRRFRLAGGSGGVAAPSANRFGHVSPTTADHVLADLDGRIDAVLDGGPSQVGVESTIVELVPGAPATLLRPGGVPVEEVAAALGEEVVDGRAGESRAAGMLTSHYAPDAPVTIADEVPADLDVATALIGPAAVVDGAHVRTIALAADADDYAAELYDALRRADAGGAERIVIVPPRSGRILAAVLDRLAKAAADR
ncbi:MAG: L-threonylcarbamoyladenylate synthase [Acidimicrobiales bacterium]